MLATLRHVAREAPSARLADALRSLPLPLYAVLAVGSLTPLSAMLAPPALLLERVLISATGYLGLALTLLAWIEADGRARAVRGWVTFGFGSWCALQVLQNIGYVSPLPFAPNVLLLGVALAAAGAYRADLAGRMPVRQQLAVYLDAAVMIATVSAALLVFFGERALADAALGNALLHAVVFGGIVGATMILDLTVLAELRPRGAYALLAGLTVLAVGYVLRAAGTQAGQDALHALLISAGALVVAYGTATWNGAVDRSPRYAAVALRLRNLLPLAAAVVTPLLVLVSSAAGNESIAVIIRPLAGLVLFGVVVRQSLLLQERERMLRSLAVAGAAAERRNQQIAGLEAVGRLLATAGPTYEALNEVVEVIHTRFGYAHVAVYLKDGDRLRLGAQHGYEDLFPVLDGSRGVVGRAMRTQQAQLVPDVTRDADYLMADPRIRSEICAPLLDDGEFLGVLDVESAADEPLDETDLAAVVAVADQVATAMALALRRQRLLHEHNFTSALLDTVAAVIVVTDPTGRVVRFNPACVELTGYAVEELRQHESFAFLLPPEERQSVAALVHDVQTAGVTRNTENDWIRKDGTRRRIAWSNRPLLDSDGRVEYVLATGIDITERKRLEEQLAHRALHDPLTGLPNRALLMDRLDRALRRRGGGLNVGLLFIDLDDFKLINDTLGHEAGDIALGQVADRLKSAIRPDDTAARVGGDEFAVVLEGLRDAEEATMIAARVLEAVGRLEVRVAGSVHHVDASIGVATTTELAVAANDLLRNADIAMYAAKTAGGGRFEVFRPWMYASIVERRQLERELVSAIEQREFALHYQPIFRLDDQLLIGAEALVRWAHPQRGLISPAQFLEVAEATGLIVPIGAQILRDACAQMAAWAREFGASPGAPRWMSVNVSARQIEDPRLFQEVRDALAQAELDPRLLVIEITESLMIDGSEATATTLRQLKELGVRFAIDDFGTGYSSLSYLRRFPVELLKIDRSFVAGVDSEAQQSAFVGALIAMGRTLGLSVLAEGIETDAQYVALKKLGCELGQGFFLGKPVAQLGRQIGLAN